jgi:integrase
MIFKYLDNKQYDNSQSLNNCVLPIFIRVLLGCGLRKSEAINLKNIGMICFLSDIIIAL